MTEQTALDLIAALNSHAVSLSQSVSLTVGVVSAALFALALATVSRS